MANYGKYYIAVRLLLLKQYLEANAGRNRIVKRRELEQLLEEHDMPVEKRTLYADFAAMGGCLRLTVGIRCSQEGLLGDVMQMLVVIADCNIRNALRSFGENEVLKHLRHRLPIVCNSRDFSAHNQTASLPQKGAERDAV